MSQSKLTPITRNNKFYSEEEFNYELSLIEEYIEEDLNQVVVVYEVDRQKTNIDSIYKESKQNIRYKPPKEIPCLYEIKNSELKTYDETTQQAVYSLSGNLTMYVPIMMFKKYNCDIKRGDYLGVQIDTNRMEYYVVTDDGKVNSANANYVGAWKPAWRTIMATTAPEFNGK